MTPVIALMIILLATVFTTIAGVGATIIVTKSFAFQWLQHAFDPKHIHWSSGSTYLNKLFNCPLCWGFWQGSVFQLFMILFVRSMYQLAPLGIWINFVLILFQGCITSLFSMWVYLIFKKLNFDKE